MLAAGLLPLTEVEKEVQTRRTNVIFPYRLLLRFSEAEIERNPVVSWIPRQSVLSFFCVEDVRLL